MSFFGVELNAQVNKLNLQLRLNLSLNRHWPNFRTLYKGFYENDKQLSGFVTLEQFEQVLAQNGLFLKKFEYQAYQKAYGEGTNDAVNWFNFLSNIKEPMNADRRKLVETIFDSLDTDHKNTIPYTTLSTTNGILVKSFNPKEFKEFKEGKKTKETLERELLSIVNLTPEGNLTKEEFINFYDDLNINIPGDLAFKTHVSAMWNFTPQAEPKSESEELIAAVKKIRFKLIQKTQGTHEQFLLKKVFDEFDTGKIGALGSEDLYLMLVKLEIPVERRLLEPIFSKFDRNNSGLIQYNEFKNFLFFDPYPI